MIGGFLGAGKTTAIARLARHYLDAGLRVGLVTNDQAYDLVDTHALRAQGFRVGEVPGACFCCKFDDLVETAARLSAEEQPDVIITEPVGSCTDLVATVIEPLRHLHGDRYDLAPLVVLLKPEHGQKILDDERGVGFSPKAAYIFTKQIEEAHVVVVNKTDKLTPEERDHLVDLVGRRFPGKTIVAASAKTGDGFAAVVEALGGTAPPAGKAMDVDYDVYAAGEAELGWLNCTVHVSTGEESEQTFALDDLVLDFVERLREELAAASAEPAHLKVLGFSDGETAIANLVSSGEQAEMSLASEIDAAAADLIVNARVATDPEELAEVVERVLASLASDRSLSHEVTRMQHFRPGRPVPTHRLATDDGEA